MLQGLRLHPKASTRALCSAPNGPVQFAKWKQLLNSSNSALEDPRFAIVLLYRQKQVQKLVTAAFPNNSKPGKALKGIHLLTQV